MTDTEHVDKLTGTVNSTGQDMGDAIGSEPAQETDWKALARKWEERSKENKTALDQLQQEHKTLAEQTQGLEEAKTSLAAKVEQFEAAQERDRLVTKVSEETDVPANLIRGETEQELRDHAAALKPVLQKQRGGPVIPSQADMPSDVVDDPMRDFTRNLFNKDN